MGSVTLIVVGLALLACGWLAWDVTRALRIARRFKGPRVVTCPETGRPAAVSVDVWHAVKSGVVHHEPQIRLRTCSRWPERSQCDERCLAEASAPESTTQAIVDRAIKGKPCALCAEIIERTAFLDHYAAFLQPDHSTIEWPHVPPEQLQETARTRPPVCWNCHVAETFRRQYPELVTDRPWHRG